MSQDSPKCLECGTSFSEEDEARALQHETMEFSLDEIATAAAQTPIPSEEPEPRDQEETLHGKAKDEISTVTDRISSTFSKIAETMKVESKPKPTPPQTPMREAPSKEPASMREQREQNASDETMTEAEQKEALPEPAAEQSPQPVRRTKTRKLKAKPK